MTLVLTQRTPAYVLQVADRLLTRSGTPVDTAANKSIVCISRRAVVTIGYSGLAQVRQLPMDEWLVEQIINQPLPRNPEGVVPIASGPYVVPDVGLVLARIRTQLEWLLAGRPSAQRRMPFYLIAAGWRLHSRRPRVRPVTALIWKEQDKADVLLRNATNRRTYFQEHFFAHVPPQWLGRDGADTLKRRLLGHALANVGWDAAEQLMVEAIRTAANSSSTVGRHCMSILVPRPDLSRTVRATFVPDAQHKAVVVTAQGNFTVPVGFTPWIVAPGYLSPPLLLSGAGWSINAGGVTIEFHGTPGEGAGAYGTPLARPKL